MSIVLPELKVGDVLCKADGHGRVTSFVVAKIGKGKEFDEPVYFLKGASGVVLRSAYTLEMLAAIGYDLAKERGQA